jgi:hypothetical protein
MLQRNCGCRSIHHFWQICFVIPLQPEVAFAAYGVSWKSGDSRSCDAVSAVDMKCASTGKQQKLHEQPQAGTE